MAARRLLSRVLNGSARRAGLVSLAWLIGAGLAEAQSLQIKDAAYSDPTTRYSHLVLGKDHNWDRLDITLTDGSRQSLRWPDLVFEDTEPRLVDMNGDGAPEVMVVESGDGLGARIAIYGFDGDRIALKAATPHIGQSNRWYSPIGAADLDGDGQMEFAFVDRPHLAKTLRVWRYKTSGNGAATVREVATLGGLTNHRIGEDFISSGIRSCAGTPELILVTGNWSDIVAVTLASGSLSIETLGPFEGSKSLAAALTCP
jgi:hypothetical protein